MERSVASRNGKNLTAGMLAGLLILAFSSLFASHALAQQVMVTVSSGAAGDAFNQPEYVVLDSAGDLFVSDTGNHRVQRIDAITGAIVTVAGTGTAGSTGDGGLATQAELNCPKGMAFDKAGNLYIADSCASFVRKVAPGNDGLIKGDGDAGETISVFAGDGTLDGCNPVDGGTATQTSMEGPFALAFDSGGNAFIATGCELVRRVDASTSLVLTTNYHQDTDSDSLIFDSFGDLLIGWYNGFDAAFPQTGQLLTGNEGMDRVFNTPSNLGGYFDPSGLVFDKAGNLFLSADGNCNNMNVCHTNIYKLTAGTDGTVGSTGSTFSTFAGSGNIGYSGDGGDPLLATMSLPWGLAMNSAGNLFIVDSGNNVIRGVVNGVATDGTQTVNPPTQNGDLSPVTVTFNGGVTKAGVTTAVVSQSAPALPSGFQLAGKPAAFFDVITSAQYTAPLTVCFNESPVPAGTTLQHFNQATQMWEDKTVHPVPLTGPICAVVDSLSPFAMMVPIPQNVAPAISSASSATFQVGVMGSFTVTTTGSPTPAITQRNALPSGVNFVDNGDGTGTLSGIPGAGTAGTIGLQFNADNGVGSAAIQQFSLTVVQAPAITSVNNVTFTENVLDTFTVTSTGFPIATLTESGALPNGVHFMDNGDGTGTLSGSATVSGTFNVSFIANNGVGGAVSQNFTLSIPAKATPVMVTASRGAAGDPFNAPGFVAFDSAGNLFVSDTGNHRVQRVDANGVVTTVAGTGVAGGTNPSTGGGLLTGNGGVATAAQLGCPSKMTFDSKGNLYVSDACQHVVWKVVAGADGVVTGASDEIISNYAGNGSVASCNNDLPSGVAAQTAIDGPSGLAMDKSDNLWILAQGSCVNVIRRVDATSGVLTTTNFYNDYQTSSIVFDVAGNLIINDEFYPLPSGQTIFTGSEQWNDPSTTLVGYPTILGAPTDVAFDGAGNLYASFAGQNFAYKAIPTSGGVIANATSARYAGTGTQGYSGDGGDPIAALMNGPQGVAANKAGNLYIADTGNNVIRAVVNGATTSAGSAVSVNPLDQNGDARSDITLTFDNVTTAGATTVVVGPTGPALPAGFVLASVPPVFFDIVTTAQFTGSIKICVNPAPAGSELLHFVNGVQDTTATSASGSGVCISVTSLSPFALVKPVVQNVAPAITSTNKATFVAGVAGTFTVTATGTPAPTLSESGALPNGVGFNAATGVLSGPAATGTGGLYPITFTATNGVSPDAQQSFVLTVNQAAAITSANSATFALGVASSFTVTGTGFPTAALTETGALPAGVGFVDNGNGSATLSGKPTASGAFTISLKASNGVGSGATQSFTLTVPAAGGGPIAKLSTSSINFKSIDLFHIEASSVTLTNTGSSDLKISKIWIVPGLHSDRDDFVFLSACKPTLAAGKSCVIYVYFFADEVGTHAATLNIADNAAGNPQQVGLTGTAIRKWHDGPSPRQ